MEELERKNTNDEDDGSISLLLSRSTEIALTIGKLIISLIKSATSLALSSSNDVNNNNDNNNNN